MFSSSASEDVVTMCEEEGNYEIVSLVIIAVV
jgi:hypothetical protein